MSRSLQPADRGRAGPIDSGDENRPWRPLIVAMLALLAIAAVVGLSWLDAVPADPDGIDGADRSLDAWLAMAGVVAAGALVACGIGWWRAERRAATAFSRLVETENRHAGLRELVSRRESQLVAYRAIGGWAYWEQDADGRYRVIEVGHDPSLVRLRQLLGTTRDTGARVDDPIAWARTGELLERRQPFDNVNSRRMLADGSEIDIEESGRPRFDTEGRFVGYYGLVRERRDVPATSSRFDVSALAAVPMPVAILERRQGAWRLAWANAETSALTGLDALELGATDPSRWIVPDRPADHAARPTLASLLDAERGSRIEATVLNRFGEGTPARLVVEAQPGPGGRPLRLLLVDTATPERARLQRLATGSEQARREQAARALELEVTARELESFSHTVSHDLRAPLRVVDGFARILLEDFGDAAGNEAQGHLRRILSAAGRMNEMIEALLSLARISSQRVTPEPVDLSAIAQSVIDELRQLDPARRVRCEIVGRMQCRGDRVLLRIVLQNLLGNAWKYTSRRDEAHIVFDSELLEGTTVYRVTDNGTGFDMDFAEELFQIFRRLHSANDFPGTGIGLATVQRIVRRHGGRIWAESERGAGARFSFTLWDPPPVDAGTRPPTIPLDATRPPDGRTGR